MKILVADDDKFTRNILNKVLSNSGFEIVLAENGLEALDIIFNDSNINIIISDWMMPNLSGLDLCKKIREKDYGRYLYIIMLTSKDQKEELIEGMEAGADDFITKPFNFQELKVRLRAGERIIKLEKELDSRNSKLEKSKKELEKAYITIKDDLEAASRIQQSLLPKSNIPNVSSLNFESLFIPSNFVAGDLYDYFLIEDNKIGFYILDVAGHGVQSAMLSVTLNKYIHKIAEENSLNLKPSYLLSCLNDEFQADNDSMKYFTIIFGVINLNNNEVTYSQAGHPPIIKINKGGTVEKHGDGGLPIGMFVFSEYEDFKFSFNQGDRLFVYSDGFIECEYNDKLFDETSFINCLIDSRNIKLKGSIEYIESSIKKFNDNNIFSDDLSILGIEFNCF